MPNTLLTPAIEGQLRRLQTLVEKWTPRINLVAKSTVSDIWSRHILDSVVLCDGLLPKIGVWADLGAGGGFPGLVVAIILAEQQPGASVVLVESDLRKSTFLREAARQLGLNVDVRSERAEALEPLNADVISARALASLDVLCGLAARHLAPGGICFFPKGEKFADEVENARRHWRFDLEARENLAHKGAALLVLRNLSRVS
ncbi:MAG: 16S rRNA (guanine(527)-N(7))-methyltransferase RsmG [Paracoccaceae bacterium]